MPPRRQRSEFEPLSDSMRQQAISLRRNADDEDQSSALAPPPNSAPTSSSDEPEPVLRLFSKIPIEIQSKIFRYTIAPGMVNLHTGRRSMQVISGICHDSRQEFLKMYTLLRKKAQGTHSGIRLRINYDIDTVNIGHASPEVIGPRGLTEREEPPTLYSVRITKTYFKNRLAPVRFAALPYKEKDFHSFYLKMTLEEGDTRMRQMFTDLSDMFPKLEVLTIVFGGRENMEVGKIVEFEKNRGVIGSVNAIIARRDIRVSFDDWTEETGLFKDLKLEFKAYKP